MTKTQIELQNKKRAVEYLLSDENTQKHITKSLFKKVGKKFNLKGEQVKTAYINFLNFDVIDLRKKSFSSISLSPTTKKIKSKINNENRNAKQKIAQSFKIKNFSSEEFGNILHEYLFNYEGKVSNFLIEKEINYTQWYAILKEFRISGKLLGRRILDFTKYKKLDVKTLLAFSHHINNSKNYKYYLKNKKKYKDVYKNKTSLAQYTKAMHVLDLYL